MTLTAPGIESSISQNPGSPIKKVGKRRYLKFNSLINMNDIMDVTETVAMEEEFKNQIDILNLKLNENSNNVHIKIYDAFCRRPVNLKKSKTFHDVELRIGERKNRSPELLRIFMENKIDYTSSCKTDEEGHEYFELDIDTFRKIEELIYQNYIIRGGDELSKQIIESTINLMDR